MSFAETPVSSEYTIYLKDALRRILKVKPSDVLEWHINNGEVVVRKKVTE